MMCPRNMCSSMIAMVDGLVNVTQSPLGEVARTLIDLPSRDLSGGSDVVTDDPLLDGTMDLMFVTLVFFIYLVQIVKFLTLPLRDRLEQRQEAHRIKRLCMIIVKAILSGTGS